MIKHHSAAWGTILANIASGREYPEVVNLLYDVLFPQALDLFGVIAKLAQPRVRVLGKSRGGPWRRRLVVGKKKAAAGYDLLSGGAFKLGDEVAAREMRVAEDLWNAQHASRRHAGFDQRLLPFYGAAFHQFR